MTTVKQLEDQVTKLTERVGRVQTSNSQLRDEVHALKNNYNTLTKEVSERLEIIYNRFQNEAKK